MIPFLQYIILTWLREKRKFSDSISLAQFDLDVNFIEDPLSNFSSLGKLLNSIVNIMISNTPIIENFPLLKFPFIITITLKRNNYGRKRLDLYFLPCDFNIRQIT